MEKLDLEKFRRAVDLAQLGKKDEAHALLRELRVSNPSNNSILLWEAYTATDLLEARSLLRQAAASDPTNAEIIQATSWLVEQEKLRLGKRFRGEITGAFIPLVPAELKNVPSSPSGLVSTLPPTQPLTLPSVTPPGQPDAMANSTINAKPRNALEGDSAKIDKISNKDKINRKAQNKRTVKVVEAKKVKVEGITPTKLKDRLRKILIGLILTVLLLGSLAGGLLLIQPIREFVFNTGPLTQTEQNFINDVAQVNDLATTRINLIYNCIVNVTPKLCTVEDGYKQAYVGLGEVKDKFQALKNPSGRFESAYNALATAYSNLGTTSSFAFESINQHKMVANQAEVATRLDNGRKLLEQGKAELKSLVQQYAPKK